MNTAASIAADIKRILTKKAEAAMRSIAPALRDDIAEIVGRKVRESDTAQSIISGTLRRDFGLSKPDAQGAIDFIVSSLEKNIQVKVAVSDNGVRVNISLIIQILGAKVSELLSSSYTSYISAPSGELIAWLEWLLTKGTQVVIADFEVINEVPSHVKSRSGEGYMKKTGGDFRVEPRHAGTISDNFITKAILSSKDDIQSKLISRLRRAF